MYDRKTWIVIGICSVLLAINLYYNNQNAKVLAAEREKQRLEQLQNGADTEQNDESGDNTSESGNDSEDEPGVLTEVKPEPVETTEYTLETDKVTFTLTSWGGGIKSAELKDHKREHDSEDNVILNDGDSSSVGSLSQGVDGLEKLNYAYVGDESEEGQKVVFAARHPSGLIVKKTWSLTSSDQPGHSYLLDLQLDLQTAKDAGIQIPLSSYSLYLGTAKPLYKGESRLTPSNFFWRADGDFESTKSSKFKGGWFSDDKAVITESIESAEYAGVSNQFFATVIKPAEVANGGIWAKPIDITIEDEKAVGVRAASTLPDVNLDPGVGKTLHYQVFMGPKENRVLKDMGEGWGDIVNYGWWIIGIFSWILNWLLVHVHDVVAKISGPWSWGIAIIAVTVIVRFAMWPLYARSNRTMKRMAKLKPEMDKLKEKYPDDPAEQQKQIMGLYRKFGINPLGGCLPMLAQMPIFFGFYRMLQHAVELRGYGFLWVDDLSLPDTVTTIMGFPINVLPIVMAGTSFLQMSMMPNTSGDKTQMMIMKLMPIIFLLFCYNFAAALALYWTTSNIFSIAQTWITKKLPEPELKERKGGSGKSFMERMAEAAEQQQKMKQAKGRVVDDNNDKPKKPRGPRTGG